MPVLDWVEVNRGISSCTLVDSALCGRNALLSCVCTSEVLPDSGPSAPPVTSQATITSAGTSQRHTLPPRVRDSCLRSEEHTSELQSRGHLVCRLLLEKKKN